MDERPGSTFRKLVDECLTSTFEFYPTSAVRLGIHTYDGKVGDYRPEAVDNYLRRMRELRRRVEAMNPGELTPLERYEADLICWRSELEEFVWEKLRKYEWNPLEYIPFLDVSGYLKRQYAPLELRLTALLHHLQEVPRVVETARLRLRPPLPLPVVETSIEAYEGYRQFLEQLPAVLPPAPWDIQRKVQEACSVATVAVQEFLAFLERQKELATLEFAIGETLFSRMLQTEELLDIPLNRLLTLGEEALRHNQQMVTETVAKLSPGKAPREVMAELARDHPSRDRLLEETREILLRLRKFLVDHPIVTLPADEIPLVAETPPYERWAFAMMDSAGPFEEAAVESYYYVTLPQESWTPEAQEAWLSKYDRATLEVVSIHEVFPGHFLHLTTLRNAPTPLAKAFKSYAFVEGWAHYCEEMLFEEGYGAGNLRLRMGQLSEALLRNVRYLVAIQMHTQGMSVEEATRSFMELAYMAELPARKEAIRGTFDPMYLNYLLGKLLIRQLREDYTRAHDGEFSLREFHDQLLSLGAPPLPLARKQILAKTGEQHGKGR